MSKNEEFLVDYVVRQIATFFPDGISTREDILANISTAIKRTEICIDSISCWRADGFNYLITGQYAAFLYYLSNTIWKNTGRTEVATRIFLLNKALNGIDLYFEVEMPEYFIIGHTVGMVFAKATYGNFNVFYQGCTVGLHNSLRPRLGEGVVMFPGSMIIGNCEIRENTVLAPGVILVDIDTPGNCYVLQDNNGRPSFKELNGFYADKYFERPTT